MKTKLIFTLMLAILAFVACSEDESGEFCENPGATCPDDTAIDASACCTSSSCYWTYKGTDYPCNGTNCNAVTASIITDACVAGVNLKSWDGDLASLQAQMEAVTEKLLAEARASCADCK
ncbi:hypothetical protein SAMN06265379_10485 [Saccharicrinis carchari]|uniref:Lipoprotein n=1 Tax=Saccharicrinis carchari TaxID=1168039 RepID=A0A521D0E7_SACCC|nr:hypothetical protein [Saccharicrinis carchari]SMO65169.1 hypothetical protein SAMN06265379_10485 [Saccharicrinis carchari]